MRNETTIKTEEDLRTALVGLTQFQIEVLVETYKIPKGKVSTYSRIAKKAGKPSAHRAVANIMNKCPHWPLVPCHRVVKSDGGFGGDVKRAAQRRRRIRDEGVPIKNGKVDFSQDVLF
ncbi:MAG: methylated-DNA--[protein]-cysteine S-methyltransferase [Candidatus Thorarchaeota archaeon]